MAAKEPSSPPPTIDQVAQNADGLIRQERYEEAEKYLRRYLFDAPDNHLLLSNLANLYHNLAMYDASAACFERALLSAPTNYGILSNYSNMLQDADKLEKAETIAELAYELAPDNYKIRKNLANKYRDTKKFAEARALYEDCLKEKPDDIQIDFDIGFMSLYMRDLDKAWEHFEKRLKLDNYKEMYDIPLPKWDGKEDISNKKLLICAEQGFGDTILLTRFLPLLKGKAKEITLACDKALHPLFKDLGVKIEDAQKIKPKKYDLHIPMMSIPPHFEKDWLKWPKPVSLGIDAKYREKFKWLKSHAQGQLKIGIVWSGNPAFKDNKRRSAGFQPFLKLSADNPEVQFYSFQKGNAEADMQTEGIGGIVRLGHMLKDFADTAAALEHMDLIIMTDSALAHLSGTIGVPVLNLLHTRPYWLYFPEKPTTELYPSMRFLRQEHPKQWQPLFEKTGHIINKLHSAKKTETLNAEQVLDIIDRTMQ